MISLSEAAQAYKKNQSKRDMRENAIVFGECVCSLARELKGNEWRVGA